MTESEKICARCVERDDEFKRLGELLVDRDQFIAGLKEQLSVETRAAGHWMKEANQEHNQNFRWEKTCDALAIAINTIAAERDNLKKERDQLKEDVEASHMISGSFFEALKPLQLQTVNVTNPGQHITDLIAERDKYANDAVCHRVMVENLKEEIILLKTGTPYG